MAHVPEGVLTGKPHRLTMGLRALDLATWLDADPTHPQRRERERLLLDHRDDVVAVLPQGRDAAAAVAERVAQHVGAVLPGRDEPLVEAARLVRDDLCVVQRADGHWSLVAAVVCFPSRWNLADKVGKDVLAIHDPVPGYRSALGRPTLTVFESLTPRWRLNWTLLDDPALFQPRAPSARHRPGFESYLRVERQCLVPVGEAVAFTIRTDVIAVAELPTEQAQALMEAAAGSPADLADYRGWERP